jgi:hypothetical protein
LEEIKTEKKNKIYNILITKTGIIKKYIFCSEFPRATSKINFNLFQYKLGNKLFAASWKTDCPLLEEVLASLTLGPHKEIL